MEARQGVRFGLGMARLSFTSAASHSARVARTIAFNVPTTPLTRSVVLDCAPQLVAWRPGHAIPDRRARLPQRFKYEAGAECAGEHRGTPRLRPVSWATDSVLAGLSRRRGRGIWVTMMPNCGKSPARERDRKKIHVSPKLIRDCVEHLSKHSHTCCAWQKRPLRVTIRLIYCLNGLPERLKLTRFDQGFRRPKKAIDDLEGLRSLCLDAERTGKTARAEDKLRGLCASRDADADFFGPVLYEFAAMLYAEENERIAAIQDGIVCARLLDCAEKNPGLIADLCKKAIGALTPRVSDPGRRGGARNYPNRQTRAVIESLGLFFEFLTGRRPAYTYQAATDKFAGAFIELCQIVLTYFGMEKSGKQVFRVLKTIDIERWRAGGPPVFGTE
jgi:hypothetical protein